MKRNGDLKEAEKPYFAEGDSLKSIVLSPPLGERGGFRGSGWEADRAEKISSP